MGGVLSLVKFIISIYDHDFPFQNFSDAYTVISLIATLLNLPVPSFDKVHSDCSECGSFRLADPDDDKIWCDLLISKTVGKEGCAL